MTNCIRASASTTRAVRGCVRAAVTLWCVATLAFPTLAAASQPTFSPPQRFYLALGDSIAYGYQLSKDLEGLPPAGFDTGYVDDFTARLRAIRPAITVVNYACPGESTSSFVIAGACPWTAAGRALHDPYATDQLDAAVAFLRAHRGQVSPVTLTLWANDVSAVVRSCAGDLDCIANAAPAALRRIQVNLDGILTTLRSAAPDAEIIVTGAWDSFIGSFEFADPLFEELNASLASVAANHRARFADMFPAFNPQGDPSAETQAICDLTLLCGPDGDSHPSDRGYHVISDLVFEASGYARLAED